MAIRLTYFITVLLVCAGYLQAQTGSERLQTSVTLGSNFTGTSGYGSALTGFVAPVVTYRVNPRLTFRAGVTVSNTTLFGYTPWFTGESVPAYDANFTKALIVVQGSYLVTPRLLISGGAFKEFTLTDDSPYYNPYTQNNPQGIYLNANYRITDRVFIQAGFRYTQGYTPWTGYNDPLYDPLPFPGAGRSAPFGMDPFNDPLGGRLGW